MQDIIKNTLMCLHDILRLESRKRSVPLSAARASKSDMLTNDCADDSRAAAFTRDNLLPPVTADLVNRPGIKPGAALFR